MELTEIAEESARGSFSLIVGTAASTIISAVGVIVMARLLGPADYGLYTLALVLPGLFVGITDLGLSSALTRYGARLRSERNYGKLAGMIGSGLLLEFVVGVVAFLLAFVSSDQLAALALQRQDMGQLVALASVTILFQGLFGLSYSAFVGLDRMGQGATMLVLRDTARVIMSSLLIIAGFGAAGAIGGQIFGSVLASLLGVGFLLAYRQGLRNTPSEIEPEKGVAADIETMMRYGAPLYVGALVSTVLAQYRNIVLAFFTSNTEIGNFNAATNFGALIAILATPVATALFPAFSKLDLKTRKEELQRMFDYSVKYTTLLIIPLAILVAALSRDLIRVIYGAAYGYAETYLPLYVSTFLLTTIGSQVVGPFLSGIGRTKENLKITLVQFAVSLPTAPVAAWLYHVPGLIVASLLSGLVGTAYGLRLATKKYGMHVHLKDSAAVLAVALVSVVPILPLIYYSTLPSLANVFVGGFIYLAAYLTLAPLFKAVRRTDLEILAPILGQIRILRPVTDLIFAYERRLLNILERISTT